jgi:iron complex outermembrane receptor protein
MAAKTAQFNTSSRSTHSSGAGEFCRPQRTLLAQAVSTALIASVASGPLLAQEAGLEEIIVTATKRAESVMDVPLAITAMSGEAIREVNLNDIKDLIHLTPGITGNSKDSFLDFVSVRGIRTIDFGNGGDPSVSLYKNGLYQGRTGSGVSSLFDIERSEVLRGPQGFLFGRGSVSGAMNIITEKPNVNETGGFAELDVGERGVRRRRQHPYERYLCSSRCRLLLRGGRLCPESGGWARPYRSRKIGFQAYRPVSNGQGNDRRHAGV